MILHYPSKFRCNSLLYPTFPSDTLCDSGTFTASIFPFLQTFWFKPGRGLDIILVPWASQSLQAYHSTFLPQVLSMSDILALIHTVQ